MHTNLRIVSGAKPPVTYTSARGIQRMKARREQLLAEAVKYILEGSDGTAQDRLRTASDLSGIPRMLLEVETAKRREGK